MTIAEFDHLSESEKYNELFKCCGSTSWANLMLTVFPANSLAHILISADEKWAQCEKEDYLEAFTHHPKIGDKNLLKEKFASTAAWALNEQSGVNMASDDVIDALAKGNQDYQTKFGYIFIVCATGKSAEEMLGLLELRLPNNHDKEIEIAAIEQAKITRIRLEKLFS